MESNNEITNQTSPDNELAERSDERKLREERLLNAAAVLLIRWGYRKTTIDDVAREAGVGKGTIYLHWKDKNDLFRATIRRAHQQAIEDLKQRIAADPEGGLPHRLWMHSMVVALNNPLVAAMIKGQPDIFQGLVGALDPMARNQLVGDSDTYVARMQQAGLIRSDLPAPVITYLIAALKMGIITAPDLVGQDHMPSMEQLAPALSDLIRRWLEPEQLPEDVTPGKHFLNTWMDNLISLEE